MHLSSYSSTMHNLLLTENPGQSWAVTLSRAFSRIKSIFVTFDNDGSDIYTILEVDTRDRPGLLYDLTRTLAASHIYIASAVIATYGAQVVDTFYVKDMFGLKLCQKPRQEALEKKLRQAIVEGAERATT